MASRLFAQTLATERYEGTFFEDRRHGHGRCTYPDGSSYTGQWQAGEIHGQGRYEHSDGSVFEGQFDRKQRVCGKLVWRDGDEYEGQFESEIPHGNGERLYHARAIVHRGEWVRGEPCGVGQRRELNSCAVCSGTFNGAELNGEGEEVSAVEA